MVWYIECFHLISIMVMGLLCDTVGQIKAAVATYFQFVEHGLVSVAENHSADNWVPGRKQVKQLFGSKVPHREAFHLPIGFRTDWGLKCGHSMSTWYIRKDENHNYLIRFLKFKNT